MGWSIGFDSKCGRDIGYGVPCLCDHPKCSKEIDRGLDYVCGGDPYGGERGCGLYFCGEHLILSVRLPQLCDRCLKRRKPYDKKPDVKKWIDYKMTDPSWSEWRKEQATRTPIKDQGRES
jgi:hypothetical protein